MAAWGDAEKNRIRSLASSRRIDLRDALSTFAGIVEPLNKWLPNRPLVFENATVQNTASGLQIRGTWALLPQFGTAWQVVLLDGDTRRIRLSLTDATNVGTLTGALTVLLNSSFGLPITITGANVRSVQLDLDIDEQRATHLFSLGSSIKLAPDFLELHDAKLQFIDASLSGQGLVLDLDARLKIGANTFAIAGKTNTANLSDLTLAVTPPPGTPLRLKDLLSGLRLPIPAIPDFNISALQFIPNLTLGTFKGAASIEQNWGIGIGRAKLNMSRLSMVMVYDAGHIAAELIGSLALLGVPAMVTAKIDTPFILSGELPATDLSSVLRAFIGEPLPNMFPKIAIPHTRFVAPLLGDDTPIKIALPIEGLGQLALWIFKSNGAPGAVLDVRLTDDWKPSRVADALKPLDLFSIMEPTLSYSTVSYSGGPLASLQHLGLPASRQKGLMVTGELDLTQSILQLAGMLLGKKSLPAALAFSDNLSEVLLEAKHSNTLDILPGVLQLSDASIQLRPSPYDARLKSTARLDLFGQRLPELTASVALANASQHVTLSTNQPWPNPLGLPNLTVNKLVVDFQTTPSPAFGFAGEVVLAGRPIKLAVQLLAGGVPSLLVGEFAGRLSMQSLVKDLVGVSLPEDIVGVRDAKVYLVGNPLGVAIGLETYPPGASLQGIFEFLDFAASGRIACDPNNGISGRASLSKSLEINPIFRFSNEQGNGPPMLSFESTRDPVLEIDGSVSLFELKNSVKAKVTGSGLAFRVTQRVGTANVTANCTATNRPSVAFDGTVEFPIVRSIGPIRLVAGGPDLGTIALDTGLVGALGGALEGDNVKVKVSGTFQFLAQSVSVPTLEFDGSLHSFAELPVRVADYIVSRAAEIFKEFLSDASRWLAAIAKGLIKGVENIALALRDHFAKTTEFIANAIASTLNKGMDEAARQLRAIGESAEQVASALRNLGNVPRDIRRSMESAGFPPEVVGAAMALAFPRIPHADAMIIPHGDFAAVPHLDVLVIPHGDAQARPHADVNAIPHLDAAAAPHGDALAIPHGDVRFSPHGDANAIPHGDIPLSVHVDVSPRAHVDVRTGHVDARGLIHGDFGGIHGDVSAGVHGDVTGGPHIDIAPTGHVDIRAVAHIDTQATGHVDLNAKLHGDSPATVHLDAAASLHVDSAASGHIDSPSAAHVDTPAIAHVDAP